MPPIRKKHIPFIIVGIILLSGMVWNVFLKDTSEPLVYTNAYIALGNSMFDPAMLDCARVYLVPRSIPESAYTPSTALRLLLSGPTAAERAEGYFTSLNDGVTLLSVSVRDGVAYADFNERLQESVGGSCRVTHIRSQIENTLRQFQGVTRAVISIDGRSEDILQP